MAADKVEAAPTISKEDLQNALTGVGESDLKAMCVRLTKSHEDIKEMIEDLEAERDCLKDDSAQLRETIELMMKEMQKLNIGAGNCVDPILEEGRLDFVGRFWEKVKPRDTAVAVSEHVGEIKKPISFNEDGTPVSASSPTTHQVAQQVAQLITNEKTEKLRQDIEQKSKVAVEQGKRAWGSFQASMGPLWQRAQGLLQEQSEPADSKKERKKKRRERKEAEEKARQEGSSADGGEAYLHISRGDKKKRSAGSDGTVQAETSSSAASSSNAGPDGYLRTSRDDKKKKSASGNADGTAPPTAANGVPAAASGAAAAAPAPAAPAATAAPAAATAPAAPAASASPASAPSAPAREEKMTEAAKDAAPADDKDGRATSKEQISSTILIEALLKIDDGSIQTLQVRAADRCKEVAQRFIQEHSLKAWFVEPLTAWLKKVEADADKFPVKLEGDLMEIRKQHSRAK